MGKFKEKIDLFVIPSSQFDVILGRQWFKLRRPAINHSDDSLHFTSIINSIPRTIIVPLAGSLAVQKSHNFAATAGEVQSEIHQTLASFWSGYSQSREKLKDRIPISMMRITAKVLDELVSLPSHSLDDGKQFDPPHQRIAF